MQVNQKLSFALVCFLVGSAVGLTGCQSIGFKQPKITLPSLPKPDMGKLAFWKKGDSENRIPPPPARVFDPAPISGDSQLAVRPVDGTRGRFDNRGDQVLEEVNSAVAGNGNPIRKPYSNDIASNNSPSDDNRFEFNTGNVRSKLAGLDDDPVGSLSSAQQDFQSAMNGTSERGFSASTTMPGNGNASAGEFDNSFVSNSATPLPSPNQYSLNEFNAPLAKMALPPMGPASSNNFSPPGNFSPAANSNDVPDLASDLMQSQAQIDEARQQIEALKRQVAQAGNQATPWAAPTTPKSRGNAGSPLAPLPAGQPVANQPPAGGSSAGYAQGGFRSGDPANILRSSRPLHASVPGVQTNPYFPATSQPGNGASAVSQSAYLNGSTGVESAASRIPNYVSDVDIPQEILQGSGSYSPGSVNRLKSPIQ